MGAADFQSVLVICKDGLAQARALGQEIENWLNARGIGCHLLLAGAPMPESLPQLAIVLGGDGTILGAARRLAGHGIPILGINFGRVGFLTALDADDWRSGLERTLAGSMPVLPRMGLTWRILRNDTEIASGVAINDVVLSRDTLARLISIEARINDRKLGVARCDGMIVCSPLGSSGYNLSAGGAILQSDLLAMSLAPICPFMAPVPPLVLAGRDVVELEAADANSFLTVDGQEGQPLHAGDVARITGQPGAALIAGDGARFFERLRANGVWNVSKPKSAGWENARI